MADAPAQPDLETAGRDYRRARELLWMAAHDLSAPLAAIRMHLRAKERQHHRQPLTGDDWLVVLSRVERLVENAQAMIDDVLSVERLKQRPPAAPAAGSLVDAEQILASVIAMQSAGLKRAGCSVFVKRRDDLDNVLGRWNPMSLERLFSNLIRNVIRHAPGAPIEVSFANREGYLQIYFADGGPGLPFDHGFDKEGRAPAVAFADSATSEDGHGLGLWIVYRLVAEMQGEITMQSRAGKGLAFDIRLPFGEVSGGDQAVESCQP
ncbi:MAG TPA: HAMP domain-containing sensor histidine kinase [Polyangia bacterium]|nr:HAMP domain-containing sensor histidine kinase [Polyangia bacterium]